MTIENKPTILTALRIFSDKIIKVQEEETTTEYDIPLKEDLTNNNKEIQDIISALPDLTEFTIQQKKMVCLSLLYYIEYLKTKRNEVCEKVENLNIHLDIVNEEIDLTKQIQLETCPRKWNSKIIPSTEG